jgi:competence protein ComEC
LAAFTIRAVEAFAGPSWAAQDVGALPLVFVLAYYAGLALAMRPGLLRPLRAIPLRPAVPMAVLAAFSFWSWGLVFSNPDGLLRITLLNVEGEAILMQTPGGRNMLINGGPSAVELSSQLGGHLPLFAGELDWLLVAGERPEQINGLLAAPNHLPVAQTAWASLWPSPEFEIVLDNLAAAGVATTQLHTGQELDLGEGVSLHVLAVGSRGATLLLSWGDFQALLPLGLDFDQIEAFSANPIAGVDLLLLADSGYPSLNPAEWISGLDAGVHWLTADGTPSEELLRALDGRSLMWAGELGWLQATTDGDQVWLSAEHAPAQDSALMQP